ncbi:unnamed protein product, partial [Ranitomeya imitator]
MYFKSSNLMFTSELRAIKRIHAGILSEIMGCLTGREGSRNHGLAKSFRKRAEKKAEIADRQCGILVSKEKWNSSTYVPVRSRPVWSSDDNTLAARNTTYPFEKIQTFAQLLENILQLE